MSNNVLAVENILRPAPTPKTATADTPKHPFPSIETEPKTQNTPPAKTNDQPAKSHDILSKAQNKPQPDQSETAPSAEQPSTDPLTTVPQSAVNPEIVPQPAAEAEESAIEAPLKSQSPVISTAQLQQQAMPEASAAKDAQPAQSEQNLIQQEVTEETAKEIAKAASSFSPVVPDARQDPKEAMPNLPTPLTKETTSPTATITPTVKPQPEDKQPQIVAFDGEKTALANEQTAQQGQPTLTGNSAGRNPLGQQVSAEQSKRTQKGNAENASGLDIERLLFQHEAQPRFTRPIAAPVASAGKNAQAPSPPVQLPSPAEQIIESIHSTLSRDLATRQITIRLNPPELGKVSVQFEQHEDHITGLLKVATLQTRHEVEQALPGIVKHLQDAGIQVKRLNVVLNDQAQQQAFREHAQGQNPFAQDEFARGSGTAGDRLSQWLRPEDIGGTGSESPMLLTDHSINMLI